MLPNDEQLQISDAARQFAQERLKPFAAFNPCTCHFGD